VQPTVLVMQTEPAAEPPRRTWAEYSVLALAALLIVALRWHTIDEPIDCDEAAYGYVAHRVLHGDRLYVDVFENKPPLAYMPYAAAIALGGYSERSLRVLPVPFVLVTLWLVWRFTRRHAGAWAAAAAVGLYAVASSDPFTFANGANLEVYMNAFLTGSLCAAAHARETQRGRWALAAGACAGAAAALKQVAVLFLPLYGLYLCVVHRNGVAAVSRRSWLVVALGVGFAIPWMACVCFAAMHGVLAEFFDAAFVYGPKLAHEAAAELRNNYARAEVLRLGQWSLALGRLVDDNRWLLPVVWLAAGNPHATVWWAGGTWPLWIMGLVGVAVAWPRPGDVRRLVIGCTAVTLLAVSWPGLFWQHYYMLLLPGLAILAALSTEPIGAVVRQATGALTASVLFGLVLGAVWITAAGILVKLQWVHYVRVAPDMITTRYKGGGQWVALRQLGAGLRSMPGVGRDDRLFNWGWQSPLHLYSGLDSVTPYFFTDPLMQRYDTIDHPVVRLRKARILDDIETTWPKFIFIGQPPFRELQALLRRHYVATMPPAAEGRGLYIRSDAASTEPLVPSKEPR
jgi:4-amino-4-deoxy-L-arabinose transferase-like glycosyltransferase